MDENENIFTGKTVDDAIAEGLKALGITLADAEIKVIDSGKKGIFGLGAVKAQVQITVRPADDATAAYIPKTKAPAADAADEAEEDAPIIQAEASAAAPEEATAEPAEETEDTTPSDAARAAAFIDGLLPLLRIGGKVQVLPETEDGSIAININTQATYKVIGKRGEVLDAIQCIAGAVANIGRSKYKKVVVDCENYREDRNATLERLAGRVAKKAVETGRKIKLEPMNPYERRIIHSTLTDTPDVTTMSEGKEPNRYVVVIPSNAKPYDKGIPFNTSHSNRPGGHGGPRDGRDRGPRPSGGSRGNFNRDKFQGGKPYDRDRNAGGNSRGPRDSRDDRGPRDRGPRDSRDNRDRGPRPSGGSRPSGAKKTIHFGTFLGNSNDKKED